MIFWVNILRSKSLVSNYAAGGTLHLQAEHSLHRLPLLRLVFPRHHPRVSVSLLEAGGICAQESQV